MSNKIENNKKIRKKSIKYGMLHQKSDIINIEQLFNDYFDKIKPNIIKNSQKRYEFSLNKFGNINFIFDIILIEEIKTLYNKYNFFIIFIDIQSSTSIKTIELYLDQIIDCDEDNSKKCYIFGVYTDEKNIAVNDEKIAKIVNSKNIYYEYSEININLAGKFPKGVEYIIGDSKEIQEEIEFAERYNMYDKGKSCIIT